MCRPSQIQILLFLVLCHQLVQAASAATSDQELEEPSATSLDNRPKRTLFNIVLGCASTIIISAWRSVHPNIPPQESYLRRIFRKLELLICTIIAPEILPLWALKQWIAAAQVRDIYNRHEAPKKADYSISALIKYCIWTEADKEKWFSLHEIALADDHKEDWTSTHGHYLVMGGFKLIELVDERGNSPSSSTPKGDTGQRKISSSAADQCSPTTMDHRTVKDIEKAPVSSEDKPGPEAERATILTLEMLEELIKTSDFRIRVTEREINDRSRADMVSKIIFVLQTWWFITQCIARGVQGLDITQLELTTVAFASLNVITFILWMNKPLGAQVAMRVHLQCRLTEEERDAGRDHATVPSFRAELPEYISICFQKGLNVLRFKRKPSTFLARLFVLIPMFVLSPIIIVVSAITFTFYEMMFTSSSFPANASHVPPYYTPRPNLKSSWYYSIILTLLCTIVGGIHCAGWNLTFPTDTQRDLWHAASLAVTIIPFLSSLILTIKPIFKSQRKVIFVISVVAYVAARVFLVAQALALLRNQPPSAFLAVDWTTFVPHA